MITHTAGRRGDDGMRFLLLQTTDDSDIIVTVRDQDKGDFGTAVRFCTGQGGGYSPNVLRALRVLRDAIEADNEARPIGRTDH